MTTEKNANAAKAAFTQIKKIAEQKGFKIIKASELKAFEYIKCGLPPLDELGGARRGGYIVRFGNPGCGKTTLSCRYMAEAQRQYPDLMVLLVDAELKFDAKWAATQGVDLDRLLIIQNEPYMEAYFDAFMSVVATGTISYAVIDSISAMTPKDVLETSKGIDRSVTENQIAADAKKIQQFLKMSKEDVYKYNVACEIIAQVRTHGIGGMHTFDDFSGGHMMRHMATQIWKGDRTGRTDCTYEKVTVDGKPVEVLTGFKTRWTLVKDTGPNESRRAFLNFVVGVGFDDFECHLRAAVRNGVIAASGGGNHTIKLVSGEAKKIKGWDNLVEFFRSTPEELTALKKANSESVVVSAYLTGTKNSSEEFPEEVSED